MGKNIKEDSNFVCLENFKKHATLAAEFDRYVVEHPKFAKKIPKKPRLFCKFGDDEYNNWSIQLANKQRESGQKVVYVKVKGLKPPKSRLIKPEVTLA